MASQAPEAKTPWLEPGSYSSPSAEKEAESWEPIRPSTQTLNGLESSCMCEIRIYPFLLVEGHDSFPLGIVLGSPEFAFWIKHGSTFILSRPERKLPEARKADNQFLIKRKPIVWKS
ncbi:hypothetical protein STEG23_029087 [Scotinomys teguina]